jgi:uncharacterized protein (DUF58 family)
MSRHAPEIAGAARSLKAAAPHHDDGMPLVTLSDITEIELLILRRLREITIGDHRSRAHGSGFDYVGLRDWQAGDRFSTIDWAQSSLTNFSPLIVREFEQPSTSTVIVVADASASTRCGVNGVPVARGVARAVATIGMSAVFFQDMFGLVRFDAATFDAAASALGAIRPRIGRNQVIHCLDAYQDGRGVEDLKHGDSLSMSIGSFMRRTALVPFVSDFLFENPESVVRELGLLNSTHDVFIVLIDAAFAFEMPRVSSGWVEAVDVETGQTRMMSRGAFAAMAGRVRSWQDDVASAARHTGLDVVRIGPESAASDLALAEFVAERRLRKVS